MSSLFSAYANYPAPPPAADSKGFESLLRHVLCLLGCRALRIPKGTLICATYSCFCPGEKLGSGHTTKREGGGMTLMTGSH